MIRMTSTPAQVDMKFELFPLDKPPSFYMKVTHIPSSMKWTFTPFPDETQLMLRERAFTEVTAALKRFKMSHEEPDPSVEPERVAWPPVEPADPRFSRSTRKLDKTTQIGELQVTQVYTNKGSLLMRAFHTRTGTSMSIWANADETPIMAKVRVVRMMAAALRASSPGAIT